jgi:hypothetical protein
MDVRFPVRKLAAPLLLAIGVLCLWNTFLVYPLKIFVVFLHELSHGLAAILTGGSIERIELSFNQGGVCLTRGGSEFVILSAGYLGSMLWGALLLILSARTQWDRLLLKGVAILTLIVTVLYVRSIFGFLYGLGAGIGLLLIASRLSPKISELFIQAIAITSCLYSVYDILSDLFFRSVPESDANALARLTGIPSVVWAILWTAIALFVATIAFVISTRGSKSPSLDQAR